MNSLVRFTSALATLALACSSGTSDTSTATPAFGSIHAYGSCKNTDMQKLKPGPTFPSACDTCQMNKCGADIQGAFGTNPNAFGGACGKFNACACDCGSNKDTGCTFNCLPDYSPCKTAIDAFNACTTENCAAECRSTTTADAGNDAGMR